MITIGLPNLSIHQPVGGVYTPPSQNKILAQDGQPIKTQDNQFIVTEGP